MSKASDVRDELVTELSGHFPSRAVDPFILPRFERKELSDGARIAVRNGGREIRLDQGPDQIDVIIEIAVVGITPENSGQTDVQYLSDEFAACDGFDELMEELIQLWMNNGPLAYAGIAGHSLQNIEQAVQFDAERLHREGVYLSMIRLTYRDSEDD